MALNQSALTNDHNSSPSLYSFNICLLKPSVFYFPTIRNVVIYTNYMLNSGMLMKSCVTARLVLYIYTTQNLYHFHIHIYTCASIGCFPIWLIARAKNQRKTSTRERSRHKPIHTFTSRCIASRHYFLVLLPVYASQHTRVRFLRHQHRNVCRMLFLAHMPPPYIVKQYPTLSSYQCVGVYSSFQLSIGVELTLSSRRREHFPTNTFTSKRILV